MKLINKVNGLTTHIEPETLKIPKAKATHHELYDYVEGLENIDNRVLISIILPMYNEENTIRSILEELPNHNLIEIIVVDDNSSDNSLKEIQSVRKSRKVKVIHHKKNTGYGGAIKTGIKFAVGDVAVTMDADGQHDPDDIYNLVKPILDGVADLTIGSRYKGAYYYNLPVSTRFGEVLIEKLIQIPFGVKIMNNQNGFRAFKKDILHIIEDAHFLGYAFCTEQILQAIICKYRIEECPIKVYNREYGSSKIILRKLLFDIFSCLSIYYLRKIKSLFTNRRLNLFSLFS